MLFFALGITLLFVLGLSNEVKDALELFQNGMVSFWRSEDFSELRAKDNIAMLSHAFWDLSYFLACQMMKEYAIDTSDDIQEEQITALNHQDVKRLLLRALEALVSTSLDEPITLQISRKYAWYISLILGEELCIFPPAVGGVDHSQFWDNKFFCENSLPFPCLYTDHGVVPQHAFDQTACQTFLEQVQENQYPSHPLLSSNI